jgi:putative metalloenzyme radical SAM/SPASM domain maturase
VTHLLPYDEGHVGQIAYDSNTMEALDIFRAWKRKADADGIDLRGYSKAMWKWFRTPEEQKVVEFVQAMMAEGRSREVFIHVDNLLKRDESLAEEVNDVFEKARAVAHETGLDLRLPGVAPKNDRTCDFVDGGGAFVSWDGKVHPCYFLWHKFQCHFSGRKKYVNPQVFGDLAEKGMSAVWNGQPFRSFREEVLRHEYPFCSNCNLLPCEYIYTEEFEQDCYTNTVPCGDCFWCMGLFQCLS